ncbi:MAG: cation transporter [Clostridium sp.]|nr:cation transporter [Prevotella sp.]MCM1429700.1 cation transporter [Clostridium sp.]MCM1474626.1 cation transporter [Muribaculaceae bacterium]
MNKTFKIEVDCANCANLVEETAAKVAGVKSLTISFMTQKMKVSFEDDVDQEMVLKEIMKAARKIEPDFEVIGY